MSCVFICEVWLACGGVALQGKSKCYREEGGMGAGGWGGESFVQITGSAHYRGKAFFLPWIPHEVSPESYVDSVREVTGG